MIGWCCRCMIADVFTSPWDGRYGYIALRCFHIVIGCDLPMYSGQYGYIALSCFHIVIGCGLPMYNGWYGYIALCCFSYCNGLWLPMCNGRYDYIALSCLYIFINVFFVIVKLGGHIHGKLQIFERIILIGTKDCQDSKVLEYLSRLQKFLRPNIPKVTGTNSAG